MTYRDLFQSLNRAEITYVVSRRYDRLPEDTIHEGGDVDIVVEASQFHSAITACKRANLSTETPETGRRTMYHRALSNPKNALRVFAREPTDSVRKVLTGNAAQPGNPRHRNEKLYRGSQMVHIHDNLAYKSPMNGVKVPVDPSVTEGMLRRRQREDCFFVPTSADELAHIVPHCVFDKDGEFSSYYVDRCGELRNRVRSDEAQRRVFEQLLEEVFFEAGPLVLELINEGRYSEIRTELKKFADY